MTPQEEVDEEDRFERLFESALEEERVISKTLFLPDVSRSCSNVFFAIFSRSLGNGDSGKDPQGSGRYIYDCLLC